MSATPYAPVSAAVLPCFFDVVGHTERFAESLLLLTDAAGLQDPLGCPLKQNRGRYTPNATEASLVEAVLGAPLVRWYTNRLAAFDRSNKGRANGTFARRASRLSELRATHAAALMQHRSDARQRG